jgi:hypothetical protein
MVAFGALLSSQRQPLFYFTTSMYDWASSSLTSSARLPTNWLTEEGSCLLSSTCFVSHRPTHQATLWSLVRMLWPGQRSPPLGGARLFQMLRSTRPRPCQNHHQTCLHFTAHKTPRDDEVNMFAKTTACCTRKSPVPCLVLRRTL